MATMLVTVIAAPQPTYSTSSTSSTCQLIIVMLSMSSIVVMWVLSMCGLRRCCLRRVQKYVTALSRSRPRPRPGGTICGGKPPVLLPCRVESSRATCAVEKRQIVQNSSFKLGWAVIKSGTSALLLHLLHSEIAALLGRDFASSLQRLHAPPPWLSGENDLSPSVFH
ncbi:unnamed protein product [Arctogadus glacialis]